MIQNTDDYKQQRVSETLKAFEVVAENGLSDIKASPRIEQYGYNEIEEKGETI